MGSCKQVVRVGLIGAGAIARFRHLPALKAIEGVDLVVVCNSHAESSAKVAADYGIAEVAADWKEVIGRSDIDVVWIGTTPNHHAEMTIAALNEGKHVFCQARMAMDLAQSRLMLAASERHPAQVTMLCPPPTGMKHGSYFEKLLREGAIGKIYHFNLRAMNAQWSDASAPAHWRQKVEVSGNNIMSVGIYGEVLGRFLGDAVSLSAQGHVFIADRQGYSVQVPDTLQVLGEWPGHILGSLQWSGVAHNAGDEQLDVFGSQGRLTYDFNTDEILCARAGDATPTVLAVPPEFVREWTVERDFIAAVRDGSHPEPSFATGLRYMKFVEAIIRSMALSARVDLAAL
jgi:predicted dehydrogenase